MRELFVTQCDAFLNWAGVMFLIYAFFWCRRALHTLIEAYVEEQEWNVFESFYVRMERAHLTIEGRCWAMIGAATISLWTSAAWTAAT